jgi:hypothetical protein
MDQVESKSERNLYNGPHVFLGSDLARIKILTL